MPAGVGKRRTPWQGKAMRFATAAGCLRGRCQGAAVSDVQQRPAGRRWHPASESPLPCGRAVAHLPGWDPSRRTTALGRRPMPPRPCRPRAPRHPGAASPVARGRGDGGLSGPLASPKRPRENSAVHDSRRQAENSLDSPRVGPRLEHSKIRLFFCSYSLVGWKEPVVRGFE